MRMRVLGQRIAAGALAVGMVTAAQLPATASDRVGPVITISAKSALRPVTGDVFVLFRSSAKFATAVVKGTISGGAVNEVARLYSSKFPYKSGWTQMGTPVTLTGTSANYAFTVTPRLATRYKVKLFMDGTSTVALASSAVQVVYVTASGKILKATSCVRPTCHISIKFEEFVPASTLSTEIKKPWNTYFGINFSSVKPRYLHLGAGNGHATRPVRVSFGAFTVTVSWSFAVDNRTFFYGINFCARDTESTDGLNLPGHHHCGDSRIFNGREYLG